MENQANDRLLLEVEVGSIIEKAEELKQSIVETIPDREIFTLSGEISRDTRWGATLWSLTHIIANLKNLGF